MSKTDEIFEASVLACEIWNQRHPHKVAIGVRSFDMVGNIIVADGLLNFYVHDIALDGEFKIGNNATSWDDPMEFVYGWLECIEESFHMIYE